MGSKSKTKHRSVDFKGAIQQLSYMMDQKHMEYTKDFTQGLSSLKLRLEVMEDLLIEKMGETENSLTERTLLRLEKMQGFEVVDTPAQKGSVIRIKVKEEVVGKEQPTNPLQDAFMVVGRNQINPAIDTLSIGAVPGQTLEAVLPDPDNAAIQKKITFTVMKVFKGEESLPVAESTNEQPEALPVEDTGKTHTG